MGWGDIFAGITAAGAGVGQGYMWHKEQEQKAKIAEQTNELREMLGRLKSDTDIQKAEIGAQAKRDVAERNERAKIAVQELVNTGDLAEIKSKGEWDEKIAKLHAQNKITLQEMEGLNRMSIAELNQQIQAAHDKANVQIGRGHDAARVQSSQIGADASRDVAQTHEGGKNYRFNTAFPLDVYKAQTKAQRPLNASPFPGAAPPPQNFAPSYSSFLGGAGGSMTPAPASGAPPLSAPQPSFSFGKPAGPSPVGPQPAPVNYAPAPPPLSAPAAGAPAPAASGFGPSEMLSSAIAGAPPAAPPAPPRDIGAPLPAVQQPPLESQPSFWTGLRPVPGGKSGLTDDRMEEQADELMRRMDLAKKTGDRKTWSSLRQQLTDMMKNQ